jgi:hypothetical protein
MRHPLEIITDHGVTAFIGSKLFTLWSKRKSNITKKTITAKHITYVTEVTNMTDGMGNGEPHICEDRAAKQVKVRMDLECPVGRNSRDSVYGRLLLQVTDTRGR